MPAIPNAPDRPDEPIRLAVGTGPARRDLAVRVREGAGPAVVWLGGFRSDMGATKALALDAWARASGRRLVRFDYGGHGESGGRFEDGTISTWLEDACAVVANFAGPSPVLVGSSMGGWIAALLARELRDAGQPAHALVLIAPAFDFTEKLMWDRFGPEIRATIERDGVWLRPTDYGPDPVPVTRALIEDGRRHGLLDGPFDPGCPVEILQGMDDPDVPYGHALRIVGILPQAGTVLTLIADGDHRLSRPADIARLVAAVDASVRADRPFSAD
ncbi:alpha/beta hydrolase [Methylobacterium sp. Leaf108]|uniref:alpha/beta hydrolase n=1 Tax=Methylobacterium sp. Leaf108 TaxID=1736256 RepID=UPI0006F8DEA4|nr:alpha/beta hydrolase [Methylobacterium sp. Leaf108]KQP51988.1 alpha/beta hydrolase [Methylobacterium sp. Leaf108]